jgi:cytochrome c oxidase subunit 2
MLLLLVGWGVFFIYTLIRFRRAKNQQADYSGVKSHMSSYLEVTVAIVEGVLLIGFSIPFWAKKVNAFPPEGEAVHVRVVAEQFAWNVHYPGADGVFGRTDPKFIDKETNPLGRDTGDAFGKDDIATLNQMHVPVNKPVVVRLSSKDVIHSFTLTEMRVKQDAIPGMEIPIWFEPVKTGNWEIACSQLCGLGHYRMRGFFVVHDQAGYDEWVAERLAEMKADEAEEVPPASDTTVVVPES